MHRFFVSRRVIRANEAHLSGEVAHQINRVLRLRAGDQVCLFDGSGFEYGVKLASLGKEEVVGQVVSKALITTEPAHHVTLHLSLLNKPDKFEWALQKCTELGAGRFVPVKAERSVTTSARRERWGRIIQEAAEQSGRGIIPDLEEVLSLAEALDQAERLIGEGEGGPHVALMPALGADLSVNDALEELVGRGGEGSVSLFIGPEGGFTDDELYEANERGVLLVNLGPRTLRSETAAVAALAIVMHELEEMGQKRL